MFKISSVSKQDKQEAKEWSQSFPLFFGYDNLLTGYANVKLEEPLPKGSLEFLVYNIIVLDNKYDTGVKLENYEGDRAVVRHVLEQIFTEEEMQAFSGFWNFWEKYINKANEEEVIYAYLRYQETLKEANIDNFNKYIIYLNKLIYTKQEGFNNG